MSNDTKPTNGPPQAGPLGVNRSFAYARDRRARDSHALAGAWIQPARQDEQPALGVHHFPPLPADLPRPLAALGVRAGASGDHRAALSEAAGSLTQLIERVPAALAVVDANMNELLVSNRWRAMRADTQARGGQGEGTLIGASREREERLRLAMDIGVESSFVEKVTGPDGPAWVRWRQAPWRRPDGALAGAFVLADDITRETARQNALQEENDALRAANDELRALHAAFARRITQPLGDMHELTRPSHEAPRDGALAASCLALLRDRVAAMRDLVQSMVGFTAMSHMQMESEAAPLEDVVAEAVADLRPAILRTGALVSVGALPTVQGDRALLAELFRRLIDNALRHAGDAPTVRIDWLESDAEGLVVRVTDDGPGIAAHTRRRAFDFFERLEGAGGMDAAMGLGAGAGMGLSACRKIMNLHGGVIAADPDWDAGLRVVMTFPAARAAIEGSRKG